MQSDFFLKTVEENKNRLTKVIDLISDRISASRIDEIFEMSVRVLLIGPVRVGKSSLINTIFDWDYDKAPIDPFFPKTQIVREYRSANGYLVLYDTPGLNENLKKDIEHIEQIRRHIRDCDLILFLFPFEYSMGFYETVFDLIINSCGIEAIKNHSIFCVTHSDRIKQTLGEQTTHRRLYTLKSYIDTYTKNLNNDIFLKYHHKIDSKELNLVSIFDEKEINDLVCAILEKVDQRGFFSLARCIDRKRLADRLFFFKKKLTKWAEKLSPTIAAQIVGLILGL